MANVFIDVHGNGTAYTNVVPPLVNGEEIIIYSTPDPGETLDDVRVWTSYDQAVAITVSTEIHLTYQSIWRSLYVEVYFSGAPIPPPDPPPASKKFPWLIAKAAQKWRLM